MEYFYFPLPFVIPSNSRCKQKMQMLTLWSGTIKLAFITVLDLCKLIKKPSILKNLLVLERQCLNYGAKPLLSNLSFSSFFLFCLVFLFSWTTKLIMCIGMEVLLFCYFERAATWPATSRLSIHCCLLLDICVCIVKSLHRVLPFWVYCTDCFWLICLKALGCKKCCTCTFALQTIAFTVVQCPPTVTAKRLTHIFM